MEKIDRELCYTRSEQCLADRINEIIEWINEYERERIRTISDKTYEDTFGEKQNKHEEKERKE